jgi:hypothetical protein
LATPNYGYEKRQRELAKKQKKEEKLRNKAARKTDHPDGTDQPEGDSTGTPGEAGSGEGSGAGSAD